MASVTFQVRYRSNALTAHLEAITRRSGFYGYVLLGEQVVTYVPSGTLRLLYYPAASASLSAREPRPQARRTWDEPRRSNPSVTCSGSRPMVIRDTRRP